MTIYFFICMLKFSLVLEANGMKRLPGHIASLFNLDHHTSDASSLLQPTAPVLKRWPVWWEAATVHSRALR